MAEIIDMPLLSDTMKEGVIAKWHKKVNDEVKNGDLLAEIETDKATMDLEAMANGVLLYVAGGDGSAIKVGDLLAIIGKSGEDVSGIIASRTGGASPKAEVAVVAEVVQETAPVTAAIETKSIASPIQVQNVSTEADDKRLKASPLAKEMAKDKGIDIAQVKGSGENGRIVKRDIEAFIPAKEEVKHVQTTSAAPVINDNFTEVATSQMRKTIARRLAESKFSAPHFYLTMEINMDRASEVRKMLNELSPTKISFNDMIIKACALALRQNPKVNSSWLGDKIRYNHAINIGMAVSVEDGLLVPVIRNADTKGMAAIAQESKTFAEKARNKELQPADWEGNTFTISNLGMFGIEEFTAIINPPDACILAIGGIIPKPIVKNGEIVVGNMMKVTLSCDHRVVDGVLGSQFLISVKTLLEEPMKMMI